MSRDDFTTDRLEAELRDVFAHQAASIDTRPMPFEASSELTSVATLEPTDELAERRHFARPRAFAAGIGVLATAAAIALFVAAISPSGPHQQPPSQSATRVLAALNKTVNLGSFVANYSFKEHLGNTPATTAPCSPVASPPAGDTTPATPSPCSTAKGAGPVVTGSATINVNPVSVSSTLTIAGISGPIDIHADDQSVSDTNGVGASQQTSNWALPDFVAETIASLGSREGSVSLLTLASPYGYLAMTDDAVRGAQSLGKMNVGGQRLTMFDVFMTPAQMASINVRSEAEAKAIGLALGEMKQEGYLGTNMRVGIGSDGLIEYVVATATFADHGTVTLTVNLSDFGCEARAAVRSQPVAKVCGVPVTLPTGVSSEVTSTSVAA